MTAVLYDYWRSSASYRVRIALNLAGIAYTAIPIDLVKGEQHGAAHRARNPQGLVPVLDIDGLRLTQSLAVIDYLDETRGLGLLPDDPAARAQTRALAQAVAVDIHPICNISVAAHAASLSGAPNAREDWMRHFIALGLAAVEALLKGFEQTPYATGEHVTLADLCLIPQLYNARRWGVMLDTMVRIRAVEVACAKHPAFQAAYPVEPVIEQT